MTTIRLTNTKTRRKEVFEPLDPTNVRMYVCGPTVYDRAHLGNARPVVVFDTLFRLLRHVYGPDHVTYVRNFTDVDDKINARAAETGRPIGDITDETIRWYHEDMDALGALRPQSGPFPDKNCEPRATAYIGAMIAMIEDLIAKGHAYEASGHVLFRVRSYRDYGALSGRSVDDMIAGARVEVAPFKEDPLDFVLWKPSDASLPGWDSPWGRGRPGWHIECSAMSRELLGESFDIHGGGLDLQFPHHENEIAQSRCAHPEGQFARVWLHNEMLQVEGRKMSKSLGNFFTVRDLLDQGIPGEVIRFVLLGTHYGKPMDWTERKWREAEKTLIRWSRLISSSEGGWVPAGIEEALCDDLNTPLAISKLHEMAEDIGKRVRSYWNDAGSDDASLSEDVASFSAALELIGLDLKKFAEKLSGQVLTYETEAMIEGLLSKRASAKGMRNFERADYIRKVLKNAGIRVVDTKDGTEWSVERDEIDSESYFSGVRSAFVSGDNALLELAIRKAREAGVHFSEPDQLDISPAWRSKPSEKHIADTLRRALSEMGDVM